MPPDPESSFSISPPAHPSSKQCAEQATGSRSRTPTPVGPWNPREELALTHPMNQGELCWPDEEANANKECSAKKTKARSMAARTRASTIERNSGWTAIEEDASSGRERENRREEQVHRDLQLCIHGVWEVWTEGNCMQIMGQRPREGGGRSR